MQVDALQIDVAWEDPETNFQAVLERLNRQAPPPGGLVVLPEMFASGFSMRAEETLAAGKATMDFLRRQAKMFRTYFLAGVVLADETGRPQNQAVLISPTGETVLQYAKIHPFSPAGEADAYAAGNEVVVAEIAGATICPLICYDLRFPETFRRGVELGAEVFFVLANWPAVRKDHWQALLIARAIENQAYVVGVNRIGVDPKIEYDGGSMVIDPTGRVLTQGGDMPGTLSADFDLDALRNYREEFPALRDR